MQKIFGTDGIRGKVGPSFNAIEIIKISIATGIFLKKRRITNKILVGKDTRKSGYTVENAIVSGLTSMGYNVIQVGPMPTPAIAFLTANMRCDGGIMISASHNPYDDNGLKFFNSYGKKLTHKEEEEIEKIFYDDEQINKAYVTGKNIGFSKRIDDVHGRYIVHIKNSFPSNLTLYGVRIVLDTANGAGYKVAPAIFEELGAEVVVINDKPNGININENCGALYFNQLSNEVKKARANLGIALDGDADRLVVVDERGEKIDGENLLASIAMYLKENNKLKNNAIVSTVMSNGALEQYLNKNDIKHFASSVGDKNVTNMMEEKDLIFGGEESGHIIFSKYSCAGDGILSALQVLALMVSSGKKASEVLRKFTPFNMVRINLKVQNKQEFKTIDGYKELVKELELKEIKSLIRYSGTENLLRILLESKSSIEELSLQLDKLVEFFNQNLSVIK